MAILALFGHFGSGEFAPYPIKSRLQKLDIFSSKPVMNRQTNSLNFNAKNPLENAQMNAKFRTVLPYFHTYSTFAKQRWLGKQVIDILIREFQDQTAEYYKAAIELGRIRINGDKICQNQVFYNSDLLEHDIHRHEPPVSNQPIRIIYSDNELVVVDKPGSIPVHPTGRYNNNSLTKILELEYNMILLPVNRLDRLTSGIIIMAWNKEAAKKYSLQFAAREAHKVYLARVSGVFPE